MNKIVNTFALIGVAWLAKRIYEIGYEYGRDDANRENEERVKYYSDEKEA